LAGDADHFHHRARRSISAPDRARSGSFGFSHKTFRRRDSCAARPESERDVALGVGPRFWVLLSFGYGFYRAVLPAVVRLNRETGVSGASRSSRPERTQRDDEC